MAGRIARAVEIAFLCGAVPLAVFDVIDHDWQGAAIAAFVMVLLGRKLVVDRRVRRASPGTAPIPPDRLMLVLSLVSMIAFFCFLAFLALRGLFDRDWQEAALGAIVAVMIGGMLMAGFRAQMRRRSRPS